jgi:hypothetical protein
MIPNLPPSGAQPETGPIGAPAGTTPCVPTEHANHAPEFDPHERVPENAESGTSIPDPLNKVRRSRKVQPDAGPFDPGIFQDGAVATMSGRYSFAIDRNLLVDATEALASMAGRSTKRPPVARMVLSKDWIKIAAVNERGGLVETLILPELPAPVSERGVLVERPIPLKQGRSALPPGTAPISFHIGLAKLLDVARSGTADDLVRLELDAGRKRVLVLGRRVYTRMANRSPHEFADYRQGVGMPVEVGSIDPNALREGLALAALVIQAERKSDAPKTPLYAYLRDGMVLAANYNRVLAVVQAKGLAGVEAVIHAADLAPLASLMLRLSPHATRLFSISTHWLIADARTCVGLPKADATLSSHIHQTLLSGEPGCRTMVLRSEFLSHLDQIAAGVKGEPGGDVIRFRLKGIGANARLILHAWDDPNAHRGVGQISC